MREEFPTVTIMAGNVVTGEMVEELILSGADIIKVGFELVLFFPGPCICIQYLRIRIQLFCSMRIWVHLRTKPCKKLPFEEFAVIDSH